MDCHKFEKTKTAKISGLKSSRKKASISTRNLKADSSKKQSKRGSMDFDESNSLKVLSPTKSKKKSVLYKLVKPKISFTRKGSTNKRKAPANAKPNKNEIAIDRKPDHFYTFMDPSADSSAFYKKLRLNSSYFRPSSSQCSHSSHDNFSNTKKQLLSPEVKFGKPFSMLESFSQVSTDFSRTRNLVSRISPIPSCISTTESLSSFNYT